MAIASTLITTSTSSIFTCPVSQEYAITTMFFCNYSASDVVLSGLYLVPNAGSASNTNKILHNLSIPAGETFTFNTEKIILGSGDSLQAVADNNSRLNVTICSLRVS